MTSIAPRMNRIKPSPSSMATMRVRELQLAGRKIIGLTVGEPDFDTPANIIDASIRALRGGQTRYTNVDGTPELRTQLRSNSRVKMALSTGVTRSPARTAASRSSSTR